MHPLEREISETVIRNQLIRDDERVIIVAVSGGPDSVALLHLLLPLKQDLGIFLIAAYVDHGLRPHETDDEKRLIYSLCEKLDVKYETLQVHVQGHAKKNKQSLEHAARELRYKALRTLKEKHNASLIAVAHNADDQAEEILIRLIRGSGRKGLSGMQDRSGDIIRPLLTVEKKRLLEYLEEKGIQYCIDSSNLDLGFLRNRIRYRLIPYLEKNFDKGIRRALCKTADSLKEDERLLEELTEISFKQVVGAFNKQGGRDIPLCTLHRQKFVALSRALQRRVVEKLLWKLECEAQYSHILQVVEAARNGTTGKELHLSRGLRVGVQREYLEFLYPKGHSPWRGKLYNEEG